jgi:hypothetical protein
MDFEIVNIPSIIPDLLKLCPGIDPRWQEHLEFWEDDERGEYNDISVIVHSVVDSFTEGNSHFFPGLFNKIEDIINSGHPQQKEIAILGFLETLQTVGSNRPYGYKPFERWLGPLSLIEWHNIEKLWQGKSNLMDVIRSEKKQKGT